MSSLALQLACSQKLEPRGGPVLDSSVLHKMGQMYRTEHQGARHLLASCSAVPSAIVHSLTLLPTA